MRMPPKPLPLLMRLRDHPLPAPLLQPPQTNTPRSMMRIKTLTLIALLLLILRMFLARMAPLSTRLIHQI